MNKNQIAKCISTGLYFNGVSFEESDAAKASRFSTSTTAEDFKLMGWTAAVEMIAAPMEKKSMARRINDGEFDEYGAARAYIREHGHYNKSGTSYQSFSVRVAKGKYVDRKIQVPTNSQDAAFIRFCGSQNAVKWSKGELATDWAG